MIKPLFAILQLLIFTSIGFGQSDFKYWELMSKNEKEHFLNNANVNKLALDYYNGYFNVTDDDKTFILLDILTHKSNYSPLYYFLFNQICSNSDGALSETMGKYCIDIILNEPDYVINHFTYERKNFQRKQYLYQLYAKYIAYEMYFYSKNLSTLDYDLSEFKGLLSIEFSDTNPDNNETLKLFFKEINNSIILME